LSHNSANRLRRNPGFDEAARGLQQDFQKLIPKDWRPQQTNSNVSDATNYSAPKPDLSYLDEPDLAPAPEDAIVDAIGELRSTIEQLEPKLDEINEANQKLLDHISHILVYGFQDISRMLTLLFVFVIIGLIGIVGTLRHWF
jgi:hypothetical protein